jgi:hypothetical protein
MALDHQIIAIEINIRKQHTKTVLENGVKNGIRKQCRKTVSEKGIGKCH